MSTELMTAAFDAENFLAEYWQKSPVTGTWPAASGLPVLDSGELAWLATQEDVEARLVFTERGETTRYRVETGPFTEQELSNLPPQDWTLLVQDVDKHLPDFRHWFSIAPFIPSWRFDDLMISCAAPGGSVGPHLDQYDVFLCQVEGHRDWRIGEAADARPDANASGLSLLQPYESVEVVLAGPGDLLYLPPGIPHWGVARDFCLTCSVGCRAPSATELALPADGGEATTDDSGPRYRDPDLQADESDGGRIHPRTIARLRAQTVLPADITDEVALQRLGCFLTTPKPWLQPEPYDGQAALDRLAAGQSLPVHGMALLYWFRAADSLLVFGNGRALRTVPANEAQVAATAADRRLDPDVFQAAQTGQSKVELVRWLASAGVLEAP